MARTNTTKVGHSNIQKSKLTALVTDSDATSTSRYIAHIHKPMKNGQNRMLYCQRYTVLIQTGEKFDLSCAVKIASSLQSKG